MDFPHLIELFYVPAATRVDAHVVSLTDDLIEKAMGSAWWIDAAMDDDLARLEIDRDWNWSDLAIEYEGEIIPSQKFAVVTGDGAVQGAMMVSTVAVACERNRDRERPSLFVELLFAAPRTRQWLRLDGTELLRGVGSELLRTAALLSLEAGFDGRLKLESSPNSVAWYKKRGFLEVSKRRRILYEGVAYTPMELESDRVDILLPERKKGS
jgi:hypothetical protein